MKNKSDKLVYIYCATKSKGEEQVHVYCTTKSMMNW